jgi:hypothetical protein
VAPSTEDNGLEWLILSYYLKICSRIRPVNNEAGGLAMRLLPTSKKHVSFRQGDKPYANSVHLE